VKRNQRREYKYWQVGEKEEGVSSVGSPQILCTECMISLQQSSEWP
jgi:hypothetical protein